MKEYFIVANSFAAPFVSDTSMEFVKSSSPEKALEEFRELYSHPCGLYSAYCYNSSDSYHKGQKPLTVYEAKCKKTTKRK